MNNKIPQKIHQIWFDLKNTPNVPKFYESNINSLKDKNREDEAEKLLYIKTKEYNQKQELEKELEYKKKLATVNDSWDMDEDSSITRYIFGSISNIK